MTHLAAGGLCLALALMTGCGIAGPTPIVFDEPLPDDPGPDVGGRALQQEIFADGRVTEEEYERAYRASLECMRDEGFEVVGPLRFGDRRAGIAIEPGGDPRHRLESYAVNTEEPDGVDRFGPVNARCQAQWSYAVEQVYLRQFNPSDAEIQAWVERAWECLHERGAPINDPPTLDDAMVAHAYGCEPWEIYDDER